MIRELFWRSGMPHSVAVATSFPLGQWSARVSTEIGKWDRAAGQNDVIVIAVPQI